MLSQIAYVYRSCLDREKPTVTRFIGKIVVTVILAAFCVFDPTVPTKPSLNGTETTSAVATKGLPSARTINTIVHKYCAMVDRKLYKFLTLKMVPSVLNAPVLRHQLLMTQLLLSH